jgi:hypothetical protein
VEAILAGFERAGVNHGGEEGEGRECDRDEVDHFGWLEDTAEGETWYLNAWIGVAG